MAGFIRRFLFDPGLAEIMSIEGVVIIDREPPASITGVGSGTTCVVGEFEDGAFAPIELTSGSDFQNQLGGFGFAYDGTTSNNPCARARKADSALQPEYWNGNGFLACVNKRFSRLICVRVDTSVGSVNFSRLAFVTGGQSFSFALTSGQVLAFDVGAGPLPTVFTGVVAQRNSTAGAYPTTFVGGEKMNITIDEGTSNQIGPLDVVFQLGDQTQNDIVARINLFLGYTAATNQGGGVTRISGRVQGLAGNVKINSIDALVATKTGFTATPATGTGNVDNISAVRPTEIATLVLAATTGDVRITVDGNGNLRATNTDPTAGQDILVDATTTALSLGFVIGDTNSNSLGEDGILPAGTRVRTAGGVEWVTMQSIAITEDNPGPYAAKIRPANDDGTTVGAATAAVAVVPFEPAVGSFAVLNPLPISAALTEPQIDARYVTAIDQTLNANAISRETNIIVSARQSNVIRTKLRSNALDASANGLLGRMAVIRPPLKTTRAVALSTTIQPGVGAYRDQRVVYAFPGVSTFVPQVAARGLDGGAGFTADGFLDLGFDTWVASVMSQLPPEENPGQLTPFMDQIVGLERGNPDVQDMRINDYKAFRAQGIAALRMDSGVAIIQSGVTSVDPLLQPNLRNIARRRMADFIQDSLAIRLKSFNKKLSTRQRRAEIVGEINGFMSQLVSRDNPANQRIDSYSIDAKSGNTVQALAAGVFRIILCAKTLASLDDIVLDTQIGETVIIQELAEAA